MLTESQPLVHKKLVIMLKRNITEGVLLWEQCIKTKQRIVNVDDTFDT